MILVTGGTGFVGQNLIRRLVVEGHSVRTLIRPSRQSPKLPAGVSVQAAISNMADERGLRAALVGVDVVYHLAGVNWADRSLDWQLTEVEGTRNLIEAAQDAGVRHLIYLSHLGADRAAAYPLFKAKGIAEERIRKGPIPYTILRSSLVFGRGDNFIDPLAQLLAMSPSIFPLAGDGQVLLQPFWIEDLVSCLTWAMEEEEALNNLYEVGGPEHLTFREVIAEVQARIGLSRSLVSVRPSYMRLLVSLSRFFAPRLPLSNVWFDYLSASRITELSTVPRVFGLIPARLSQQLDYLTEGKPRPSRLLSFSKRQK
jgi:NADH dehydrogenase